MLDMLVISTNMHTGFAFEVHDLKEHKKITLNAPEEIYDLLISIGAPSRYIVKAVYSRETKKIADYMRRHGPFEPHRLPLEQMEYTTMSQVAKKLEGRFTDLD